MDIFISYAREDRLGAARVAEALEGQGWSVWWDRKIEPGEVWDELIERELASVSCVVALWSATSIHRPWVRAEASEALARGILVPVLVEDVNVPLAYRHIQAANLADWRGEREHPGFQQLLCAICRLLGSGPRPSCESRHVAEKGTASEARAMMEQKRAPPASAAASVKRAGAPPQPLRSLGARLGVAGVATALLLIGGTIGYAVKDCMGGLRQESVSGEVLQDNSFASTPTKACELVVSGGKLTGQASPSGAQ